MEGKGPGNQSRQEEKRTVPETVENYVTYSPSQKKKLNTMEYFINIVKLH